jgi:glutathione S-transferase
MTSVPPPPPLCSLRATATALASAASGGARDASSYPLADARHGRERYGNETQRIYRVLEKRLSSLQYLAGAEYTVADMAVFPWIQPFMHGTDLADYPHLRRWYESVKARPAVQRAYELLAEDCKVGDKSDSTHENLFDKQRSVGKMPVGEEEGGGGRAEGDARKPLARKPVLRKLDLWYTPIANHVHAVEAVINICELHQHVSLIPTSPFQVQEEPNRPGFATLPHTNPLLTVPAMKVDGKEVLYGGPVIYEYLNTLRPAHVPSLIPADEAAAVQMRRCLWLADGM